LIKVHLFFPSRKQHHYFCPSVNTVLLCIFIFIMYAAKPKLSLCIAAAQTVSRPLKSPSALPRTPISPISAASPSSKRFSSLQVPSYSYTNNCSSKSILKKQSSAARPSAPKNIQFKVTPTVYCLTPIENPDEYYGKHTKMTREERRWAA